MPLAPQEYEKQVTAAKRDFEVLLGKHGIPKEHQPAFKGVLEKAANEFGAKGSSMTQEAFNIRVTTFHGMVRQKLGAIGIKSKPAYDRAEHEFCQLITRLAGRLRWGGMEK